MISIYHVYVQAYMYHYEKPVFTQISIADYFKLAEKGQMLQMAP